MSKEAIVTMDDQPLSHVIDDETGQVVHITDEMTQSLRDAEALMVVGDLIKCIQLARIQDQKLYLASGCSSMQEYTEVELQTPYRSVQQKISVGRIFKALIPETQTFASDGQRLVTENTQALEVLGDLSKISLSKYYELTKIPDADFSEIASRGVVTGSNGIEISVAEIMETSARDVAKRVKEVKRDLQRRIAALEEDKAKYRDERDHFKGQLEKNQKAIDRAQELELLFGKESRRLQDVEFYMEKTHSAISQLELSLFKVQLGEEDPDSLKEQVHSVLRRLNMIQTNALRHFYWLLDLDNVEPFPAVQVTETITLKNQSHE